jgi:hypothetical protein
MCGVTRPTVIKAMKELSEKGVITVANQHDSNGRQLQNLYWLLAPKLVEDGVKELNGGGLNNFTPGGKETLHNPLYKNPLINKKGRFTPPNIEQVAEYCKERKNSVDAESFINHYEANGWMRGKSKVKCWRACVRTWEKNAKPLDNGGGYV